MRKLVLLGNGGWLVDGRGFLLGGRIGGLRRLGGGSGLEVVVGRRPCQRRARARVINGVRMIPGRPNAKPAQARPFPDLPVLRTECNAQ